MIGSLAGSIKDYGVGAKPAPSILNPSGLGFKV